ncbi:MAG: RNA methyltransferase, partial [Oscillospiraceae bacterium]|nr:RNA methyltransferase [Oscillospiraceae bacterium]
MSRITEITDFSDPALDVYARLTERELLHNDSRPEGMFIAESPKVISRALDAGYAPLSFLMEPRHVAGQARELLARCP